MSILKKRLENIKKEKKLLKEMIIKDLMQNQWKDLKLTDKFKRLKRERDYLDKLGLDDLQLLAKNLPDTSRG